MLPLLRALQTSRSLLSPAGVNDAMTTERETLFGDQERAGEPKVFTLGAKRTLKSSCPPPCLRWDHTDIAGRQMGPVLPDARNSQLFFQQIQVNRQLFIHRSFIYYFLSTYIAPKHCSGA